MNRHLDKLQPYPFERIRALLEGVTPPEGRECISFAMGEPRHPPPAFALDSLRASLDGIAAYPASRGLMELRQAICHWLSRRFDLPREDLDPGRHALPVNGTREALFAFAQLVVDDSRDAVVVSPNPFYQIYEGATLLAGATPHYLDTREETGFLPDFDSVPPDVWRRCQLIYICSPGNPTGAVLPLPALQRLIALADEHDFIIASDECYSEIYPDESQPPSGLLQACHHLGRKDFSRCVVFHSLSKRSNLPGLRSGFVAGDAGLLERFALYRTYHGCAMSLPFQRASIAAWEDETHVRANRDLYRQKFEAVLDILAPVMDVSAPQAGFYLWPRTPIDDDLFTREAFAREHLKMVPGSYLARDGASGNPGSGRVRLALVAEPDECVEGARQLRRLVETLNR